MPRENRCDCNQHNSRSAAYLQEGRHWFIHEKKFRLVKSALVFFVGIGLKLGDKTEEPRQRLKQNGTIRPVSVGHIDEFKLHTN